MHVFCVSSPKVGTGESTIFPSSVFRRFCWPFLVCLGLEAGGGGGAGEEGRGLWRRSELYLEVFVCTIGERGRCSTKASRREGGKGEKRGRPT